MPVLLCDTVTFCFVPRGSHDELNSVLSCGSIHLPLYCIGA